MVDLPPGLFLMIYEAFATDLPQSSVPVLINQTYKPPPQLSICQRLREEFAARYYTSTTFVIKGQERLTKWITSLPEKHHTFLTRVHLNCGSTNFFFAWVELVAAKRNILNTTRVDVKILERYLWVYSRAYNDRDEDVQLCLPASEGVGYWREKALAYKTVCPEMRWL